MIYRPQNISYRDLDVDRTSGSLATAWTHQGSIPAENIFSDLRMAVQVDGKWLEPEQWQSGPDGLSAEFDGITLNLRTRPAGKLETYHWVQGHVENNTGVSFRFGGFRFRHVGIAGNDDFLSLPGTRLRLYREGWTGVSAAGTVRFGEPDYDLDRNYLPFAVSSSTEYDGKTPNCFSAEYVTMINDVESGISVLWGFISSADQITRFSIVLDEAGANRLDAFSCGDNVLVAPGETLSSEELIILSGDDGYAMLERFAALWGQRMKAPQWDHVPSGWCSWYYYFAKVTECDMLENLRFFETRRTEYPVEYIQLDDGYQSALGDWLECNEHFPNGLKFLAEKIISAGFKPALWLAPFMVEEHSNLYAKHPDWMIKDKNGRALWPVKWRGARIAVLDCSIPAVQDWLRIVFGTLASWGYEYVKLDFIMYECAVQDGVYADPKVTRAQACRKGLQAIRDGLGDHRFILGATMPLGPAVGIVNGERIGADIVPYWKPVQSHLPKEAPCMLNAARNIICRRYMHGKLWINDPDVHIARIDNNKLTYNEVVLWTSVLWISGGMVFLGDRMLSLDPERAKLSRMLLNSLDAFYAKPLDFFEREYPSIWRGKGKENGEIFIGFFNFEDSTRNFNISFDRAEIQPEKITGIWDFWVDKPFMSSDRNSIAASVAPHSCKLLRFQSDSLNIKDKK